MSPYRPSWVMLLALTVSALCVIDASAEQTPRARRKSQPVPTSHAAPDVTATVPAAKRAVPEADDESLPKPFDLPTAPRARIKACGEKWRSIKMSGEAGNDTWREFATKCLVQTDDPKKHSP